MRCRPRFGLSLAAAGMVLVLVAIGCAGDTDPLSERVTPTPVPTPAGDDSDDSPDQNDQLSGQGIRIGDGDARVRRTPRAVRTRLPRPPRPTPTHTPTPMPPTATPTPTPMPPTATPTPVPDRDVDLTPPVPEPTATPGLEQAAAPSIPMPVAPTATPFHPTPTPTPVPPPAGYLLGSEYGLALVQTTRSISQDHQGWVDITLALAITKFGPDPNVASKIAVEALPESICFENVGPPNDCLSLAWGSSEQFKGQLRSSQGTGEIDWPSGRTWPYSVIFEVPANAARASVLFGEHRVPLNLSGDRHLVLAGLDPAPAPPTSPGGPTGTTGYFLGKEYGLAITGLSRHPIDGLPGWVTIDVELAIITHREGISFAPPIQVDTGLESTCFIGQQGNECIGMVWGPEDQFLAVVSLDPEPEGREVPWPRRKAWPVSMLFDVPEDRASATLQFGEHRVPINLAGLTGETPIYSYRQHYTRLAPGFVVYDRQERTIVLEAIEHDGVTGAAVLRFSAANNTEGSDFTPLVKAEAIRVSSNGVIFDGVDNLARGWVPSSLTAQGNTLAPGQTGEFALMLPRVVGDGFPFVEFGDEVPDAVLVQLTLADGGTPRLSQVMGPAFVPLERSFTERKFWVPDLVVSGIQWDPLVPTVGSDVDVTVTVANIDPLLTAGRSALEFLVDGAVVAETALPGVGPDDVVSAQFTWKAEEGRSTFGARADSKNEVEEDNEGNNLFTVGFGGAFRPDLLVGDLAWLPSTPYMGGYRNLYGDREEPGPERRSSIAGVSLSRRGA